MAMRPAWPSETTPPVPATRLRLAAKRAEIQALVSTWRI
jgi:hypothetical protein